MAQNDADELLILSLRRSALPVPANISVSLESITPEALVSIVVAAVRLIYGAQAAGAVPALADRLPVNISQRHKVRKEPIWVASDNALSSPPS